MVDRGVQPCAAVSMVDRGAQPCAAVSWVPLQIIVPFKLRRQVFELVGYMEV